MWLRRCLSLLLLPALVAPAALLHAETGLRSMPAAADRILVVKSERKLHLLKGDAIMRSFDISLGLRPDEPKQREGDARTPEGRYTIDAKHSKSAFFLALKVSYPNAADKARAQRLGVDPGGQIMIHGMPNDPKRDFSQYMGSDWTDGCIAVSNSDMLDIWLATAVSTPIEIRP